MDAPLLSVCLITYNHAKFIRQAIDSVLMQKVNFSWELVIADDCSVDGTREILQEYKSKYPQFIRLILQDRNVGPAQNWIDLLRFPKGKYIAYFEGDDYWIDSNKLQKQVDFMTLHPQCSGCFTDLILIDSKGNIVRELRRVPSGLKLVGTELLMQGNVIHSSTIMLRTEVITDRNIQFIAPMPYGDMALYLAASTLGPIGYIPGLTSAYRLNVGVTRDIVKSQRIRNSILIRQAFINEFDKENTRKYHRYFKMGKSHYLLRLSISLFLEGKVLEGFKSYFSFLGYNIYRLGSNNSLLNRIRFIDYFRPLYHFLKLGFRPFFKEQHLSKNKF
jgi:glycosyltransferase involved in cell wall biosynthesis